MLFHRWKIDDSVEGKSKCIFEATKDGNKLKLYKGSDVDDVTIYSELNKLASNVAFGRNMAGVHYRSDGTQGIKLGERVALCYLEDLMSTWVHNSNINKCNKIGGVPEIPVELFDGTTYFVKPKICEY